MGSHATCSGAWVSGPEDLSPPEYFWGYNRMLTVEGLFGAGDTVGGSAHKFSSGSFTEGRLAAKAAVKYIYDKKVDILIWSFLQSLNLNNRWDDKLFLILFIISNIVLFGGVYWSKFAHMFYKARLDITNKIKNTLSSHLSFKFKDCKNDHIKPNKEDANNASTNKSALIILYQG